MTMQRAAPVPPSNAARVEAGTLLRLPQLTLVFLAAGAFVRFTVGARNATIVWMIGLVITGVPVVWQTVRVALARRFATDVIASLAIVTAVVLVQPLAGLVIVLMQTGGEALERFAEGRASAAVRALEEEAPRIAHRLAAGQTPHVNADGQDIAVGEIAVGDLLLVRPGEMVPCDADVIEGSSHCDTSRLTGEPIPCRVGPGAALSSGIVNLEGPLVVRASKTAGDSQYAKIVELVRSSQASKAPLQRLADRYAMWFTPVTLVVCAVAYLASGDTGRVLAVLVVATPCPLILATPIAIIGGVNRAARRLIVVRHGGAMEQLAEVTTAVFDKTGTLTVGKPIVDVVLAAPGFVGDEVLASASAVEQGSGHLLARSVVETARARGLPITRASGVTEAAGQGVRGMVGGREVCVGARSFVQRCTRAASDGPSTAGADRGGLRAYVAIDGRFAGTIEFADRLRPGLADMLSELRRAGIERCVILSGDSQDHTDAIAAQAGITEARGELLPEHKVEIIGNMVRGGTRVLMVGDGTNDAPALGTATVGVALAGHGGGITAEAADIVILNDDLGRVAEAIQISRRTLRIARQSIWAGLGLSAGAMVFAALGYVPPAVGALLQEGIDVAVILNALRTSRPGPAPTK
jgi:heavy metal translocating P-type ATPase